MRRLSYLFFFLLVALGVGFLVSSFINRNHVPASAAANYKKYCASCHGENLRSFVDRQWVYGNSWNEVYKAIKVGYPDDGMPAYDTTFTNQEINDLVDYILGGIEKMGADKLKDNVDYSEVIESQDLNYRVEMLVDGLDIPWGIAFLPKGELLITERDGRLFRWNKKKLQAITGVPKVKSRGQGGLLDVTLHPDFEKNNWVYLSFSKPKPGNAQQATTAIVRAKLKGNSLTDVEEIFEAQPYLPTAHHYGSKLQFDREGYLYFSVGDRGRRNQNPQSLDNHCGKIHRINADGSIPKDNPFVDRKGAKSSIYSYGHRNPQGVALNPVDGTIWESEHGPRGGDEVNAVQKGKNYGWPTISYGINYNGTQFTDKTAQEGMEQPELYWVPSIAPCGMDFINNERYGDWYGDLFVGSLRFNYVNRCIIEDGKIVGEEKLLKDIGRVRAVRMSPDGYLYVAVEGPGKVFKVIPVKD